MPIASKAVQIVKLIAGTALRLSCTGLPRGPHVTRYFMYQHLSRCKIDQDRGGKVLSISHSNKLCGILGLGNCEIVQAVYPQCTLLALPFDDNQFDYVVSDQVLEHVEGDPQLAINESYRVLRPGGFAIHTTCLINPVHYDPDDFWRFTPHALKLLCGKFGGIIEANGWGNPYVWVVVWLGLRYEPVPESRWHPLHKVATFNDEEWPVVTWVIARK